MGRNFIVRWKVAWNRAQQIYLQHGLSKGTRYAVICWPCNYLTLGPGWTPPTQNFSQSKEGHPVGMVAEMQPAICTDWRYTERCSTQIVWIWPGGIQAAGSRSKCLQWPAEFDGDFGNLVCSIFCLGNNQQPVHPFAPGFWRATRVVWFHTSTGELR